MGKEQKKFASWPDFAGGWREKERGKEKRFEKKWGGCGRKY